MKNIDFNKTWIGFTLGMIIPVIFYGIYYTLVFETAIKQMNVSLCIAANLIPFFLYKNKEKPDGLKGVVFATILWAILVFCLISFTNILRIG